MSENSQSFFLSLIKDYYYDFLLEQEIKSVDNPQPKTVKEELESLNYENPEFLNYLNSNLNEIIHSFLIEDLSLDLTDRENLSFNIEQKEKGILQIRIIEIEDEENSESLIKHLTPFELAKLNTAIVRNDIDSVTKIMGVFSKRSADLIIAENETLISDYNLETNIDSKKDLNRIEEKLKDISKDIKRKEHSFFKIK